MDTCDAAGVACVTRVVVTTPAATPAALSVCAKGLIPYDDMLQFIAGVHAFVIMVGLPV